MKILKTFETWNNNIIDHSLFNSGKAKYNPKIANGIIKYKTGNIEPYYFAEIEKKGNKFICKIYKKKKNGEKIRLRNKLKKELKLAHNYVREFLNQKLKKKKFKSKKSKDEDIEKIIREDPQVQREMPEFTRELQINPPKKTIIRKFY